METKPTILYIDDEPRNVMVFKALFEDDFNIISGSSGQEGIEILKQNPDIQIVFSDMKMPGINGIEFITRAKQSFGNKTYFLLSAYNVTQEIIDALDNKIIAKYFKKPLDVHEIESSIKDTLALWFVSD